MLLAEYACHAAVYSQPTTTHVHTSTTHLVYDGKQVDSKQVDSKQVRSAMFACGRRDGCQ
jgi:hypothetical protein